MITYKICTPKPENKNWFTTKPYETLYTDLKANNSDNDVTKLTIKDYIILHQVTNLQHQVTNLHKTC